MKLRPANRCSNCPCLDDVPCPAVSGVYRPPVPRYCELRDADPTTWDAEIRKTAYEDQSRGAAYVPSAAVQEIENVIASLTDAQRDEVNYCPSRKQIPWDCCAGQVDVCGMGYFDGAPISSLNCAMCRLESRPQV